MAAPETSEPDFRGGEAWLEQFYAGSRAVHERLYRLHFERVARAIGTVLDGADKETAIHEVFYRLLSSEPVRRGYQGGSFGAWISAVARNHAIDQLRRNKLEEPVGSAGELPESGQQSVFDERVNAQLMVQKFCDQCLPPQWARVFQARFIEQLEQAEAARKLGIRRTTLIYQEYRVRQLLERFFLAEESP
jgi:RNA polymerase sigma-70 factor (ECF subfamily)